MTKKVIGTFLAAANARQRVNSFDAPSPAPSHDTTTNCGGRSPGLSLDGTGWLGCGPVSDVLPSPISRPGARGATEVVAEGAGAGAAVAVLGGVDCAAVVNCAAVEDVEVPGLVEVAESCGSLVQAAMSPADIEMASAAGMPRRRRALVVGRLAVATLFTTAPFSCDFKVAIRRSHRIVTAELQKAHSSPASVRRWCCADEEQWVSAVICENT